MFCLLQSLTGHTSDAHLLHRHHRSIIYPVTHSHGEDEAVSDDIVPNLNQSTTTSSLPLRPPRSHLRATSLEHTLPTPPASESSSRPTPIPELFSYDAQIPNLQTILDVRPD